MSLSKTNVFLAVSKILSFIPRGLYIYKDSFYPILHLKLYFFYQFFTHKCANKYPSLFNIGNFLPPSTHKFVNAFKAQRNRHIKIHQRPTSKCSICSEEMEETKLTQHILLNHEEASCEICFEILPSKVVLRDHKIKVHRGVKQGDGRGRKIR